MNFLFIQNNSRLTGSWTEVVFFAQKAMGRLTDINRSAIKKPCIKLKAE